VIFTYEKNSVAPSFVDVAYIILAMSNFSEEFNLSVILLLRYLHLNYANLLANFQLVLDDYCRYIYFDKKRY